MDDVTVILRECGERTADAAHTLLQACFPAGTVVRVKEVPFSLALKRSFEIGLDAKRPWTLCLDADVFVCARGVRELLAVARIQGPQVFELQGLIADKFFGFLRPAGNHLYRTELLRQALRHIPAEGTTLRPEHSTILAMRQKRFVDVQLPTVLGIHDYQQFFLDIYRKCFVQAHKHSWLRDFLIQRWEKLSADDEDYRVALSAFQTGESYRDEVLIDKRFAQEEFRAAAAQLGIDEKTALAAATGTTEFVQTEIQRFFSSIDSDSIEQQARIVQHYFVNPLLSSDARPAKRSFSSRVRRLLKDIPRKLCNKPASIAGR